MQTRQTDPIIAEVRAIRQAYAARFDYDVEAIFKDIRARQEASGRDYVRLTARHPVSTVEDRAPHGGIPGHHCSSHRAYRRTL
ncbi:MAG: hypothetical protein OXI33_14525, partial [Chloroflexota bacterium]|nr:hypothetical protein [Chloroflexota bacterium]